MSPVTDMDVGHTPHDRRPASIDWTIKDATVDVITYLGTGAGFPIEERNPLLTPHMSQPGPLSWSLCLLCHDNDPDGISSSAWVSPAKGFALRLYVTPSLPGGGTKECLTVRSPSFLQGGARQFRSGSPWDACLITLSCAKTARKLLSRRYN
jgi:hypothetical protein